MKIIRDAASKDYYDYMTSHGVDEKVVFDRTPKFLKLGRESELPRPTEVLVGIINRKILSVNVIPFTVIVGSKYFGAVKVVEAYAGETGKSNIKQIFFYDLSEFSKYLGKTFDDAKRRYVWHHCVWNKREKYSEYFKCGDRSTLKWVPNDAVVGFSSCDIFITDGVINRSVDETDTINQNGKYFVYNNDKLRYIEFYRIMSPEEIYTEIYNYISSVNDPVLGSVPNDVKIEKHGFDMKKSFRHRI